MKTSLLLIFVIFSVVFASFATAQELKKPDNSMRVATFNVALNRRNAGELSKELENGESKSAKAVAEVIQLIRPDVLLINELDFDGGKSATLFAEKYLGVGQNGLQPIVFNSHFVAPVNTGVNSELDMDSNGKKNEPNDAFGFGFFPGQYGMVVYSKYEIDEDGVRTFQNFLWKDMPKAALPIKANGKPYYPDYVIEKFRLSSKSHWDLPIKIGEKEVHFLVCHPTPPVFDGPEDKNGCRNHDEIRLWSDYVSERADYLYDDNGKKGGLKSGSHFVIAGDLNADPIDGDSRKNAIGQLLKNDLVDGELAPKSTGGTYWAKEQGGANESHKGNPLCDTGDFNDKKVGNMRIDYVVPSKTLKVLNSGVFWPKPDEAGAKAASASDHRLVWIDVEK